MHPNPAFRKETEDRNLEFARERSFGVLAVNHENGPLISHIPFQLNKDASEAELHLVRSNPIVRLLAEPQNAVIAISGGDAYISPDWYGVDDQVPTWNYVAVHLRGRLSLIANEELHGVLNRLSAAMEKQLAPKKPWTSDKMDQEIYNRMQRQIVPAKLAIEAIDGTWKLSQNKPADVRMRAAAGVSESSIGAETKLIAALMKNVAED